MNINSRLEKIEKEVSGNSEYVNVNGCLFSRAELETENDRIRAIVQASCGMRPKAREAKLVGVPLFEEWYPYPECLTKIIDKVKAWEQSSERQREASVYESHKEIRESLPQYPEFMKYYGHVYQGK